MRRGFLTKPSKKVTEKMSPSIVITSDLKTLGLGPNAATKSVDASPLNVALLLAKKTG